MGGGEEGDGLSEQREDSMALMQGGQYKRINKAVSEGRMKVVQCTQNKTVQYNFIACLPVCPSVYPSFSVIACLLACPSVCNTKKKNSQ